MRILVLLLFVMLTGCKVSSSSSAGAADSLPDSVYDTQTAAQTGGDESDTQVIMMSMLNSPSFVPEDNSETARHMNPEPATVMMFIIGLGGLGVARLRKRS